MLGWLQCHLPNVVDYLYLCSHMAIKLHIVISSSLFSSSSSLCMSNYKSDFFIYIFFQFVLFNVTSVSWCFRLFSRLSLMILFIHENNTLL